MAIFAVHRPDRGRAKNLGSKAMSPHPLPPLLTALGEGDRLRGHSVTALMRSDNGSYAVPAGRDTMPLLDDDRSLHVGVELAEVVVCSGRVEFLRERCARGDGA